MGGQGISTDLDTITVPSPLLPHHFWPCSCRAAGNRKAQLSGRRFGQSGIKCRALFSHSAPGVGTPRDLHCAFSHTSLGGAAVILSLRKGRAGKQESEPGTGPEMEGEQRDGRGGRVGNLRTGGEKGWSKVSLEATGRDQTGACGRPRGRQQANKRTLDASMFPSTLVLAGCLFLKVQFSGEKKITNFFLIIYNSSQLRI